MQAAIHRMDDAQPDELVTLINTVVERVYITTKGDKRICQVFMKGCTMEDYSGLFGAADYIAQNTEQPLTGDNPVCDLEWYSIFTRC